MRYVVGDVHGHYNVFMELLEKLKLSSTDKVILVGDIVDKAPSLDQQLQIFEWAYKNVNKGEQFYMVMGNHEYRWLNYLKGDKSWLNKRGERHLLYVLEHSGYTKEEITDFLEDMPLAVMVEDDSDNLPIVVTHGWIHASDYEGGVYALLNTGLDSVDVYKSVEEPNVLRIGDPLDCVLIHGHVPSNVFMHNNYSLEDYEVIVSKVGRNINVDCGCGATGFKRGRLAAYCIDTGDCIYVDDDCVYSRPPASDSMKSIFEENFNKVS